MLPAGSTDRAKDSNYRVSQAAGQTQRATPQSCSLSCGTQVADRPTVHRGRKVERDDPAVCRSLVQGVFGVSVPAQAVPSRPVLAMPGPTSCSIAIMRRSVYAVAIGGVVLLVAGCGDRLVELPTSRKSAVPVALADGPVRCPADTVLLDDNDAKSGAGVVPGDFDGRIVLRCEVDYTTMRSQGGVDRFTVRQWQASFALELRTALNLPDRELRPARACASAMGGTTAVYVVDSRRRVVRVVLPVDDPCQELRAEVVALLPANGSPSSALFQVTRSSR